MLEQAYRSFLSAGLGELVFEMFSNSVNRAFHARRGSPNRSESATNPVALRQLSGYLTGTLNVDFGGSTAGLPISPWRLASRTCPISDAASCEDNRMKFHRLANMLLRALVTGASVDRGWLRRKPSLMG